MKIERKDWYSYLFLSLAASPLCTENQPERDAEDIRRGKDTL